MPHKHLAVEVLQRLLRQEIRQVFRKNVVQERTFSERLEELMERYQKRIVNVIEVVEALIGLACEMRESTARAEKLHLTPEEVAFYDALAVSESAQQLLGDVTLRQIAQELTQVIRANVTIDWMYREQCGPICAKRLSGSCGSTTTLPIKPKKLPTPYWNRPRYWQRPGLHEPLSFGSLLKKTN